MSLIQRAKDFLAEMERTEAAEVSKRNGVYVSRPVLNGAEWEAWAQKWKVPNPLAAADIHVTVMYSSVDVKMKPDICPLVIPVRDAVFAMFGPDEDSFVVAFYDWCLSDRHWAYQSQGAVSSWPTYRPHMTLGGVKGFEIDDAALADAPEYIILGGEVAGPVKEKAPADDQDPEGVEVDEGDDGLIVVVEIAMAAAKKALEATDLSPIDRTALYDISKGRKVTAGVAKRLAGPAAEVSKALLTAEVAKVAGKRVERDIELKITPLGAEAMKKAGVVEVLKTEDERQLIYAISNVYSIGGVTVEDSQGDGFTTTAMEEFIAEVLKKEASGTFEHEGELCNTVVQGIVMSDELQKALGIDLGFEALITATHFPDPANWAEAKKGRWEQSIRGRFWYEE